MKPKRVCDVIYCIYIVFMYVCVCSCVYLHIYVCTVHVNNYMRIYVLEKGNS